MSGVLYRVMLVALAPALGLVAGLSIAWAVATQPRERLDEMVKLDWQAALLLAPVLFAMVLWGLQ